MDRVVVTAKEHTVFELNRDLLLVYKPRAHFEPEHAHGYAQRLRVISGSLCVLRHGTRTILTGSSGALVIAAGEPHSTEAQEDTWLVVEVEATRDDG